MTARARAAKGKADSNHRAIKEAIEALGFPVMDLSAAGNGVEDLLVGLSRRLVNGHLQCYWLLIECKVVNRSGRITYKPAQIAWRHRTPEWPRLTVTSAQEAVDEIRRLTG